MQSYIDETDDIYIEECHNFKTLNVSALFHFLQYTLEYRDLQADKDVEDKFWVYQLHKEEG